MKLQEDTEEWSNRAVKRVRREDAGLEEDANVEEKESCLLEEVEEPEELEEGQDKLEDKEEEEEEDKGEEEEAEAEDIAAEQAQDKKEHADEKQVEGKSEQKKAEPEPDSESSGWVGKARAAAGSSPRPIHTFRLKPALAESGHADASSGDGNEHRKSMEASTEGDELSPVPLSPATLRSSLKTTLGNARKGARAQVSTKSLVQFITTSFGGSRYESLSSLRDRE